VESPEPSLVWWLQFMTVTTSPKILQVGCGTWGKYVLRDLVQVGASVTTITTSEVGRRNSQEFGASQTASSLSEVSTCVFDGIVVVTPITTHYEVILAAHEIFPETPIFCEKELVETSRQAEILKDLLGDHLFVMHKWRYHNGILKLKEVLEGGAYGALRAIKLDRLGWGSSQKDVDTVVTAIPHDLSILLELLGEVRTNFRSVTESSGDWVYSQTVVSPGSPSIVIDVSSHSPVTSRCVQLLFEKATVLLRDSYDAAISVYPYGDPQEKTPPTPISIPFTPNMPLECELRAFVDYVTRKGPPPKSSVEDSLKVIRAMESLRKTQDM
jgi:predicted dehydrogenase